MPKSNHCVVLVTAPNATVARKIAKSALEKELIACANLVPRIESLYRWEGKIEKSNEVLMIIKTHRDKLKDLEQDVLKNHPYDTPEFVVLKIAAGNKRYLKWLSESCGA
ncbi:MAG: divalent-cation tolerance protein CutA [Limisphaerales bacterium]